MTRPEDHGSDGLPDRGPVEDFFAREQARIEDLPGNDLHWQGIVREGRRRRRGGRGAAWVAAGAAAAVAVGVVAVWQTGLGDGDGGLAPAGQASSPQTSQPASPTSAGPESATSATSGAPQVVSLSRGLDGRRTALVADACPGRPGTCLHTRSSTDGGATWATGPVLEGLTPAPVDAPLPGAATGSDQAGHVAFASGSVGVVGGSRSLLTTDGGRTWAPYDLPGTVVWMRADPAAGVIDLATSESCSAEACTGALTVLRLTADDTTPRELAVLDPGDVVGLSLERSGEADLVAVDTPDGHEVYRLPEGDGDVEEVEVCEPDEGVRLAVPRSGGSVVLSAVCSTVADDGSASDVTLLRSTDGGRTWSGRGEPTRVRGRVTGLAQPQVGTAVLVTDASGDALYRSTDAGGTWTQLAGMFAPKGAFSGVDADDQGRVWATRALSGGYAESRDDGETWSEITPG